MLSSERKKEAGKWNSKEKLNTFTVTDVPSTFSKHCSTFYDDKSAYSFTLKEFVVDKVKIYFKTSEIFNNRCQDLYDIFLSRFLEGRLAIVHAAWIRAITVIFQSQSFTRSY